MVSRITNSMMQNTLLSNLSLNLNRMDKLQNQLSTGRKYGHISDDPSALIYGQAARNKLARLSHYQGMVETAQSWLTQAETGIMELNKVIGAVYEELVSAGSVKTDTDKQNLAKVIYQLRDHYVDTLNTAFGDRYVFGAYNTPGDWATDRNPEVKPFTVVDVMNEETGRWEPRLFFNGFDISAFDGMSYEDFHSATPGLPPPGPSADDFEVIRSLMKDVVTFDVGPGIEMPVTQNGIDVVFFVGRAADGSPIMRNTFDLLTEVYNAINGVPEQLADATTVPPTPAVPAVPPLDTDGLTALIKLVQDSQNHLLTRTAEIGGRQRRLELLEARYETDNLNYERMRSDAEDADMAEVIMHLKMAETIYQAALSAGARVIQPTLMDFLR